MFFGMDWAAAAIKISFQIVFALVIALPFSYAWNNVAYIYIPMLPEVYHDLPYWHTVCILFCLGTIGENIQKLTPKIISVSQSNG